MVGPPQRRRRPKADGGRGHLLLAAFSPDGTQLAFTSTFDGPPDAYVMDASGGEPRRISHFGGMQRVVGWSKDGKNVRVSSNFAQPFLGNFWLHDVPVDGKPTKRFEWGPVRDLTEEPSGKGRVIGINSADPARWKRYKGGTRGRLYVDKAGTGTFKPLWETSGNLASPMWIGSRIWFLSDHEGHANLYSCTPSGKSLKRHTDHEGMYARWAGTDGKRVVYHVGADLWVLDVAKNKAAKIDVRLNSPRTGRARKFATASKFLEAASLHPKGHSLALVARGGAYTMPLWEGAPVRYGAVSTARYRHARWLPDGKRFVAVTDESGGRGADRLRHRERYTEAPDG